MTPTSGTNATGSRIRAMNRSAGPEGTTRRAASLGFDLAARQAEIDQAALRSWRLDRLRAELRRRDYAGALLADPMNIRYATGTRNMAIWTMHAPGRYAFVATEGPVVLFDFSTTHHLVEPIDTVDELRISTPWFWFLAGPRVAEKTRIWAGEIATLVQTPRRRQPAPGGRSLRTVGRRAADRPMACNYSMHRNRWSAPARSNLPMRSSACACRWRSATPRSTACARALEPGITENQLWSILHETNIAHDGEWIECRLLASGERTNPWFQESETA